MKRVYIDYNATTPVRQEVVKIMQPYYSEIYGNPSSIHIFGQESRAAIEEARWKVARALNVENSEICFNSCATEGNNYALKGLAFSNYESKGHIITSLVEHNSVLQPCRYLQRFGFDVTYLEVDQYGAIDPEALRKAIRRETFLIALMYANNEVGTIQPVEKIAQIAREHNITFFTDGVQAIGKIKLDLEKLPVDIFTLSGHKIYGPKGVGAMFIRKGSKLASLLHGGGHERAHRAGTENVQGIVGLGEAVTLSLNELDSESQRINELTQHFIHRLLGEIPGTKLNGHPLNRLPGTVNISFEGISKEDLFIQLDLHGIAASSGSACSSGSIKPSHVLKAMRVKDSDNIAHVRFSLGHYSTETEVNYVVDTIQHILENNKQSVNL